MAKSDAASRVDAIGCAERCEKHASECADSHPAMSAQLIEAGAMLRTLHRSLVQVECKHVLTFTVTQPMIDSGRESRPKGKYCMTCGEAMIKEEKQEEPQA